MRAVPEGFDNVQALHSPYGAVHGVGGSISPGSALRPLSQPFGSSRSSRNLLNSSRRHAGGDSYAIGGMDLSPSHSMGGVSALASPMGALHVDRYANPSTPTTLRNASSYWPSGHSNAGVDDMSQLLRPSLQQTQSTQSSMSRHWETGLSADASQSPIQNGGTWLSGPYNLVAQAGNGPSLAPDTRRDGTSGDLSPPGSGAVNPAPSYTRKLADQFKVFYA